MMDLFIRRLAIDWQKLERSHYVREIEAFKNLEELKFDTNVTFFVGENGSGKSTLLEALAVNYGFNAEGGTKNYNFTTYESHSNLHEALKVVKGVYRPRNSYFLRAESFYNVASKTIEYEKLYDGKTLHAQSHGESFFSIIKGEFAPYGLFLLDEPEAALSISKQLSLLYELHRLSKKGAQFIIATHSPILLGLPGATIYSFSENGIEQIPYEQTQSYELTELFINQRQSLLKNLLEE